MQIELDLSIPQPHVTTIADIIPGNVCRLDPNGAGAIVMKVKPTSFLLNSSVVADVLNRGGCFVVDMKKGTCYAVEGNREAKPLTCKMLYK